MDLDGVGAVADDVRREDSQTYVRASFHSDSCEKATDTAQQSLKTPTAD